MMHVIVNGEEISSDVFCMMRFCAGEGKFACVLEPLEQSPPSEAVEQAIEHIAVKKEQERDGKLISRVGKAQSRCLEHNFFLKTALT
jgi:hypothetical protein